MFLLNQLRSLKNAKTLNVRRQQVMLYHCATNYVFINLVEDKQTRVMHVTDWRYEKGKLFQAINLFSLNRMLAAREVMRPKFRVSHFR